VLLGLSNISKKIFEYKTPISFCKVHTKLEKRKVKEKEKRKEKRELGVKKRGEFAPSSNL
jgi:hypothetical protein